MVGPAGPLNLRDYLRAWSEATNGRSPLVWADPDWLREQGVRPWEDIRNWIPGDDPEPGFYRISARKAVSHGLTYRPLEQTIHDMIASSGDPARFEPPATGMSRERERELIERWRTVEHSGGEPGQRIAIGRPGEPTPPLNGTGANTKANS